MHSFEKLFVNVGRQTVLKFSNVVLSVMSNLLLNAIKEPCGEIIFSALSSMWDSNWPAQLLETLEETGLQSFWPGLCKPGCTTNEYD